jgi:transcriptional regulator with XRE-family HTH domain
VPESDAHTGLFPALLRHWRRRRGLSQLDLALTADVSARHLSFLETGRSNPSAEMVLRLATALDVPLRHVNNMLRAVGHAAVYDEADEVLPPVVVDALALVKEHHEPFPLMVIDRAYRIRDVNRGALAVLGASLGGAVEATAVIGLNLARLVFDPAGAQPHLVNFADVGRDLLWRVQREVLDFPDDDDLRDLLDDLLAMPTVAPDWRRADLTSTSDPAHVVHLRTGDLNLRFLTMVTAFQAPQNLSVEQLRIETWLPADDATAAACRALAPRQGEDPPSP